MMVALRKPLTLIVLAYVLLASAYSVITPLWEASDELWHYPFVKALADNRLALPVQDPDIVTAWRQEGSQPPLYYMLGALLTIWIDTSDMDAVRLLNPHADIGVVLPDGNHNIAIHDPVVEAFPWRGTALAVHLVRFLSVALGAVTVLMTYRLAEELFPDWPAVWIGAACLTAFNPMFLFISGSVNNDNLSTALASLLLVQIVRLLKRTSAPSLRDLVAIGVTAGAGMLAKFNVGFLLPIIALSLALIARRRRWRPLLVGGLVTGGLTLLIGGWWYVRNWQLYGDPTGLNVFLDIVGRRAIPANWPQLWSERHTFLMSYWGFFGGVNVPLADWMYTVFNSIAAAAVLGCGIGVLRWLIVRSRVRTVVSAVSSLHGPGEGTGVGLPTFLGALLTVVWISVLLIGLLRWTAETWASQGRLMFAAIAPISLWMTVGLLNVGRLLFGARRWRHIPIVAASGWHAALAIIALTVIHTAYQDPYATQPAGQSTQPPGDTSALFFESPSQVVLQADWFTSSGGSTLPATVKPGEFLNFCVNFSCPQNRDASPFTRNWTAFVHLVNNKGLIITQRDMYPGQGLYATRLLRLTERSLWCNRFAVGIPEFAYAPQRLEVRLGFFDAQTGERLIVEQPSRPTQRDWVTLGYTFLLPRIDRSPTPNPMSANFGNEVELIGYDLPNLKLTAGEEASITLYWRATRTVTTDYRIFVQIVQPNTTNVVVNSDAMPANWTRPTTTWQPGEIIEDKRVFTLPTTVDMAITDWTIAAGVYELAETAVGQEFRRLRVIQPDGSQPTDFIYLTRVLIVP